MDVELKKLWELAEDSGASRAALHAVTRVKCDLVTEQIRVLKPWSPGPQSVTIPRYKVFKEVIKLKSDH